MSNERQQSAGEREQEECSDEEMVRAAREGGPASRRARNDLYMRYHAEIKALGAPARRTLRDLRLIGWPLCGLDMEDVDQQAFLVFCRLVEGWRGEDEDGPFAPYLRARLPGRLVNYVRAKARYRPGSRPVRVLPLVSSEGEREEERGSRVVLEGRDLAAPTGTGKDRWRRYVRKLPPELRQTVQLRYERDLTGDEIARATGRPLNQVVRFLAQASHAIRVELMDEWERCE